MQAIDQMKPTISRAMATLTTLAVLPRALSRRYRVQSRLALSTRCRERLLAAPRSVDLVTTDARLHSVSPGAFDQRASGMGVASLGDAAASDGLAARSFAWDQPEIGHELARVWKRVKSPTSATSTTVLINAIPRIACKASTTGRRFQSGRSPNICSSTRLRRRPRP